MKLEEMVKGILEDFGCTDVELVEVGITNKQGLDRAKLDEAIIEVDVTAKENGEVKHFATMDDFMHEWHFWMCGGAEKSKYNGDEPFNKMAASLGLMNEHGMSMETFKSGMTIKFTYYRWPQYDRYMKEKTTDQTDFRAIEKTLTELKAQSIIENDPFGKSEADKQIIAISRTLRACGYDFQYRLEEERWVAHITKKQ